MNQNGVLDVYNAAISLFQDIAQCPVWDILLPLFITVGLACLFWATFHLGKGVAK